MRSPCTRARVHRERLRRRGLHGLHETGVRAVLVERSRADDRAALHVVVQLRARQRHAHAGVADGAAAGGPERLRRADLVGIEPEVVRHPPCAGAAVAQMRGHRVGGLAWHDPRGALHAPAVQAQLDHVLVVDAQARRGGRAQLDRVVPGELGERLGQFLKPAEIGESAVVHRRVGTEHDVEPGRVRGGWPIAANTSPSGKALGAYAVPATTPSWTDVRQYFSKSTTPAWSAVAFQVSRTASWADRPGVFERPASTSCADLPP